MNQSPLEIDRLILRPLTSADVASIQRFASVREIADSMLSIPHSYPEGEAERYVAKRIAEFEQGLSRVFVIAYQAIVYPISSNTESN